ncbi:uronyl 2-sulfotransferase-like [Artemia franciscana]|uniref:uronyl 2-sulfotransferase-like n=1 Tax=Artemia franciscana TaxID=6661 RepID=UPI0032DB89D0
MSDLFHLLKNLIRRINKRNFLVSLWCFLVVFLLFHYWLSNYNIKEPVQKQNDRWLIYTELPYSESSAYTHILERLSKIGRFSYTSHPYRTKWNRILKESEKENLVTWFEYQPMEKAYNRKMLFFDFSPYLKYTKDITPTYISVLRKPIDRLFLWYLETNYSQTAQKKKYFIPGKELQIVKDEFKLKLEKLHFNISGLSTSFFFSTAFFCGQNLECLKPSRYAYEKAVKNIEQFYTVVGLYEDANTTLSSFKRLIPRFLGKITETDIEAVIRKTQLSMAYNWKTEEEAQARKLLVFEYELYDFVTRRLKG